MTWVAHHQNAPRWLLALGFAITVVRVDGALQSPRSSVEFVDRLNIVQLYIEGLDTPYNVELQRLDGLCGNDRNVRACRERNLRPVSIKAGSVRSAPSATAPILGDLYAVLAFHPSYDVGYRIEFHPRGTRTETAVWLEDIGDWGYGIEVPGVQVKGHWIQLFGAPLPKTSWVDGSGLGVRAGSIAGSLINLPLLSAVWPDGSRRSIAPGSYLVERIRGSDVTVRAEVPTDYPCGEKVEAPAVMPPSVRIGARDLFSPDGAALFSETYGRGC